MKKLYYFAPFILVPSALLLFEFFGNANLIKMNPYIMGIALLVISAIMGNITPTNKCVDCLISAIMPVSLFVFMFVIGFLDQTETYARFDFGKAMKVATQPVVLWLCLAMSLSALILSFKPIRAIKRNHT